MDDFIFSPGVWLGEGKITFTASPDFIQFYMKWQIRAESPHIMKATQIIQMQGIEESTVNHFTFMDLQANSFKVILESEIFGNVEGKGFTNNKIITWEFLKQADFEGFETYEKQENGNFLLHAEYGTEQQYRTIIKGIIWRKST